MPGAEELTRFRKNVFAYGESHALGQSGGGRLKQKSCALCKLESSLRVSAQVGLTDSAGPQDP